MFELKRLSEKALPRALEKAERYRLLNEPGEAESICLDILAVDSDNQQALIMLLLALTDQFEEGLADAFTRARELLPQLHGEYERLYYMGIICERRAKAQLRLRGPGSGHSAYESFREAMAWYEKAEAACPPGNDDAVLRWNTCVRILSRHRDLSPGPHNMIEQPLE